MGLRGKGLRAAQLKVHTMPNTIGWEVDRIRPEVMQPEMLFWAADGVEEIKADASRALAVKSVYGRAENTGGTPT
jgi:hypothetical protein